MLIDETSYIYDKIEILSKEKEVLKYVLIYSTNTRKAVYYKTEENSDTILKDKKGFHITVRKHFKGSKIKFKRNHSIFRVWYWELHYLLFNKC